jgi:D-arabinono-1,4-lactone oxidase
MISNNPYKIDFRVFMPEVIQIATSHRESSSVTQFLKQMMELGKRVENKIIQTQSKRPTKWFPNYNRLTFCEKIEDIKNVVERARLENKIVRVGGAQHSAPDAIFENEDDKDCIRIKLEGSLRNIEFLEEYQDGALVRVGAGCNFGVDQIDPLSTEENSFTRTVDKRGYALSILGGMSHQTIAGMLMTGSSGGSLSHSLAESVQSIEFIDGQGEVRVAQNGTDLFNAVGVSMGLFGIITHITLKLCKNYLIDAIETTQHRKDTHMASSVSFKRALIKEEYAHWIWFPQRKINRVLEYTGKRVPTSTKIIPYSHVIQDKHLTYAAAVTLWLINLVSSSKIELLKSAANQLLVAVNPIAVARTIDHWFISLPNDDQILIDHVMRVQFTEVWLDVQKTDEVMEALETLFESDPDAAGNFGVEMYGAKSSPFWLSAAYNIDVIRVDPYFWEYNPTGNLESFFDKYWAVLMPISTARLHPGKHMPKVGTRYKDVEIGPKYMNHAFPRFQDWMQMRKIYDPEQIFVTNYWRKHLGINCL